ncbi:MAG: PAN domain-containing protein [Pseudomonadota bacterium]
MTCFSLLRRGALASIALVALAMPAAAQLGSDSAEVGVYRFGGTYVRVPAESPAVCAALCVEDGALCQAWSHVPALSASGPHCELKSLQGRTESRPGYTSGIAGFHQVGALRDELGTSAQPEWRATNRAGLRQRGSALPDTFGPASPSRDTDELLGRGPAPTAGRTSPSRRNVASSSPSSSGGLYAPKQVRLTSVGLSKYTPPAEASSNTRRSSGSSSGGGQRIEAQPTRAPKSADFYSDD